MRGVAEHHSLVASALVVVATATNALVDILGLAVLHGLVAERIPAEPVKGVVVADAADDVSGDGLGVDLLPSLAFEFAEIDNKIRTDGCFAGDVRIFVLLKAGIKNGIGDLVAHFVRMAFGNGFGGEHMCCVEFAHGSIYFSSTGQAPIPITGASVDMA